MFVLVAGVRICGMQTYHRVTDNKYRLYSVDKYYGRRIKNEMGLQNELEVRWTRL